MEELNELEDKLRNLKQTIGKEKGQLVEEIIKSIIEVIPKLI